MSKATADHGGQAALGDILNRTSIIIQHLHISTVNAAHDNAGLIAYFGLGSWWNQELTAAERGAIEDAIGDDVTRTPIYTTNRSAQSWLRGMALRIAAVHPHLASKLRSKAAGIETGIEIDDYWQRQFDTVRRHWLIGDFEQARIDLREIAYRMREENALPDARSAYATLLADFTRSDPYYSNVMDVVIPIIASRPGVIQSTLAKGLPQFDIDRFRHAMYYGEIIGDIKRIKRGCSYGLHLN